MDDMIQVESLRDIVKNDSLPYLLLFWGNGCGPCDRIKPVFEALGKTQNLARFVTVKTSESYKLAGYFRVMAIPTLVFINQDFTFKKFIGPKDEDDIKSFLGII
jgi:thiol-disulfide isomerase/thioredoxin